MMKIIGHRGAKGLAPENTLVSFRKAIEHGVDEIEFDVRLTRDGIAIIQHDPDLHDPAGNKLSAAESSYADLLEHKPDLVTLDQAMRYIDRAVPVLMEIKPHVKTKPIIKIIKQLETDGWTTKDMLVGSFSQSILLEIKTALPHLPLVVNETWSGVRATWRARQLNTKRLSMSHRWLWSGFIKVMYKRGYQLAPYTLNNPVKARRWARYGLYATITDYPDRFN